MQAVKNFVSNTAALLLASASYIRTADSSTAAPPFPALQRCARRRYLPRMSTLAVTVSAPEGVRVCERLTTAVLLCAVESHPPSSVAIPIGVIAAIACLSR